MSNNKLAMIEEGSAVSVGGLGEIARALAGDREISKVETVQLAENTTLMLGAAEMHQLKLANIPAPKQDETISAYIARIAPLMEDVELAQMNDLGLMQMLRLRKFSEIGVDARFYASMKDGSWRKSSSADGDFASWVRGLVVEMGMSKTVASRMANAIIMLHWLYANAETLGIELPEKEEACFVGRPSFFSRLGRALPTLNGQVEAYRTGTKAKRDEAIAEIAEIVGMLQDPEIDQTQIDDRGRKSAPSIDPITFVVSMSDGVKNVEALSLSELQLMKLQAALGTSARWLLPGQADDEMQEVEYRRTSVAVCPDCYIKLYGLESGGKYPEFWCPQCDGKLGGDGPDRPDSAKDPDFVPYWDYRSDDTEGEWLQLEGDPRTTLGKDEYQVSVRIDNIYGLSVAYYVYRRYHNWLDELQAALEAIEND